MNARDRYPCLLGAADQVPRALVEIDQLRELLATVFLYVNWRYVTSQLTTEQREMWLSTLTVERRADWRWWT